VTKIVSLAFVNLVTPKAGAKHELLFNKQASSINICSLHQPLLFFAGLWCLLLAFAGLWWPFWLPKDLQKVGKYEAAFTTLYFLHNSRMFH
jgi:hypothetical protein